MSTEAQESLTRLLLEYTDHADQDLLMEMLVSAQKVLSSGANDFAEKAAQVAQPGELTGYLKCYPLAHALIGLAKFNELNKNTEIASNILKLVLGSFQHNNSAENTLH